jgi:hypothetical protein
MALKAVKAVNTLHMLVDGKISEVKPGTTFVLDDKSSDFKAFADAGAIVVDSKAKVEEPAETPEAPADDTPAGPVPGDRNGDGVVDEKDAVKRRGRPRKADTDDLI